MAGSDLVLLLLKQTLVVLLVLAMLRALRRASAARRVFAARCALLALLAAPLAWLLLPPLPVSLPHAATALLDPALTLPQLHWLAAVPPPEQGFAAPLRAAALGRIVLGVYAAGVLLMLAHGAIGLAGLARLGKRARALDDAAWQAALLRLRMDMGVTRPVRLLRSGDVAAPMSWGWRRPLILVDPRSAAAEPDAILAHELAHIARADWPAMLAARLMLALYWWHPLMHLLFHSMQHDTECAADDAVLSAGIPASHYAQTLLSVSRHAFAPRAGTLASQIAGRGALLVARIGALLEPARARGPVSRSAWAAGVLLTLLLSFALAALAQRGEHVVWPDSLAAPQPGVQGMRPEALLAALDNPNFRQLAHAMRTEDFSARHAPGAVSFRQRAAIPALVLALQDQRPVVRRLALWGLSEMRFAETAPAVAALLRDPVPPVRAEAAAALGDMNETRWLGAMLAMLRDPDRGVRARVAHALGDLAHPASRGALHAALADPDQKVASEVRWALDEMR